MPASSLLIMAALLCQEAPAPETQVLERLNAIRQAVGLSSVVQEAEMSKGGAAHASYLAKNVSSNAPIQPDQEDPAKPGFSPEGQRAARRCLFAANLADPVSSVDQLLETFTFRLRLLEPGLKGVGLGIDRDKSDRWVVVITTRANVDRPVLYPPEDAKDVPLEFEGQEIPNPVPEAVTKPAGYPITVSFPVDSTITKVRFLLKDDKGTDLAAWLSTPEKPTVAGRTDPAACLMAKTSLKPGKKYTVEVSADIDGNAWSKKWAFTTQTASEKVKETDPVKRVNEYRARAGLEPVELSPVLSRASQAHAEYLVKNIKDPKKVAPVHEEDPTLRGYSKEGELAARQSQIRVGRAIGSVAAVDDFMGKFYHRLPFLNPDLKRIGLGEAGTGSSVFLVINTGGTGLDAPVVYPGNMQEGVPLAFRVIESPSPVPDNKIAKPGYPITVLFPSDRTVEELTATLDIADKSVPVSLLLPGKIENGSQKRPGLLTVFPTEPLQPGTTYTVKVKAKVGGEAWSKTWEFSTAKQ